MKRTITPWTYFHRCPWCSTVHQTLSRWTQALENRSVSKSPGKLNNKQSIQSFNGGNKLQVYYVMRLPGSVPIRKKPSSPSKVH